MMHLYERKTADKRFIDLLSGSLYIYNKLVKEELADVTRLIFSVLSIGLASS